MVAQTSPGIQKRPGMSACGHHIKHREAAMDLDHKGRAALVSGASAGIGAEVTRVLAQEGVRVAITARRRDLLEHLAAQIAGTGAETPIVVSGDVTDAGDVKRIVAEAAAAIGPIDILVNCAGGSRPTQQDAPDADWDAAFALNFTAARRLAQAVLPSMQARQWGRIVNTIPPGRINSEQVLDKLHPTEESRRAFITRNIPIGYFGDPEDIGHLVAFPASPLARYITGAVIPVDGGMHFFAH